MDLKKPLITTDGKPLKKGTPEGPDLTIEDMIVEALLVNEENDKPDRKLKKYRLYKKILDDNVALTIEEKALILDCAGKSLSTLVYGQIDDEFQK